VRTLVVDDDQVCRHMLRGVFERYGAVEMVDDGIAAVAAVAAALVRGQGFDLICLDIMMPGLDGRQTLTVIRRLEELLAAGRKPMSIAMATALDDRDSIFRAFRDQADLYFVKPLDPKRMIADLAKLSVVASMDGSPGRPWLPG
jgi:two-component system chemotaxis response regulator CheY